MTGIEGDRTSSRSSIARYGAANKHGVLAAQKIPARSGACRRRHNLGVLERAFGGVDQPRLTQGIQIRGGRVNHQLLARVFEAAGRAPSFFFPTFLGSLQVSGTGTGTTPGGATGRGTWMGAIGDTPASGQLTLTFTQSTVQIMEQITLTARNCFAVFTCTLTRR